MSFQKRKQTPKKASFAKGPNSRMTNRHVMSEAPPLIQGKTIIDSLHLKPLRMHLYRNLLGNDFFLYKIIKKPFRR